MAAIVFAILSFSSLVSALPDETSYERDGQLMVNICNKFAEETDAQKLHKAAVATQYARVVSCLDYNGECSLYGTCLTMASQVSQDGDISAAERIKMRDHVARLKEAFEKGKLRLHRELRQKPK